MDKSRWSSMNTVGIVGILFLLVAGTRFGASTNPANQNATSQPVQTSQPVLVGTSSAQSATSSSVASTQTPAQSSQIPSGFDPRNAPYQIEGMNVVLINGVAEQSVVPNSASKIVTRYFGNEAMGDLNGDGRPDMAYLLTQQPGGSGVFYYAVVALNLRTNTVQIPGSSLPATQTIYGITNTYLIGDRIVPQSTEVRGGRLYINYVDRNMGEPMTAPPTVSITKILKLNSRGVLGE